MEFTKKNLNDITYNEVSKEELCEWLETARDNNISLPLPSGEFANLLVENKNNLYPLNTYGLNQLASFIFRIKKIGAECTVNTYNNLQELFVNCDNIKMIIVKTLDFNQSYVYTIIMLNNEYYDNFMNTALDGTNLSNSFSYIYSHRNSPLIKYNIIDNADYYAIDESVSRFSGASWFENVKTKTILVAGIGGIGSWVAMLLSRMQPTNIILYDHDIVETANMSGQLYSKHNIGLPKVTAMSDNVYAFSNYNAVVEKNEMFTQFTSPCDIMISGFDNMAARKVFYNVWKKHVISKPEEERHKCLLIDGRLAAETFQIYCITGDDDNAMSEYENNALFDSYYADNTICSYKQTSYMANMIGGAIVNLFTNFCANSAAEAPIRTLPYYVEYEGALMDFKTVIK